MPFCFEVKDVSPEVVNFKSVLIVPCRFCPAASIAVKNNEPYIEFPRRSLKTASYERHLADMKDSFEKRGNQNERVQEQPSPPIRSLHVDRQTTRCVTGTRQKIRGCGGHGL